MELWWKHTSQIAQTWAYCLLRNHFHAVVFIKNKEDLTGLTGNPAADTVRGDTGITPSDPHRDLSGLNIKTKEPSQYFSNFFNAYARGINNATQRTGAVFERPFKRIPVDNEAYLMRLIVYVHQNPQKHKFENNFRDWNYSSYHELVANIPTHLQ